MTFALIKYLIAAILFACAGLTVHRLWPNTVAGRAAGGIGKFISWKIRAATHGGIRVGRWFKPRKKEKPNATP